MGAILAATAAIAVLYLPAANHSPEPYMPEALPQVEIQPESRRLLGLPQESGTVSESQRLTELLTESRRFAEPEEPEPKPAQSEDSLLSREVLQPKPQPTATASQPAELVYVHTSEQRDFQVLGDIGEVLRMDGYIVPETRFTSNRTQGDVRFFFESDRRAAERVRAIVQSELRRHGYSQPLQLLERDGRKFQFAAPGKIEVWLPPLRFPQQFGQG